MFWVRTCWCALYPIAALHHLADYSDLQISRRQAARTVPTAEAFLVRVREEMGNV